MTKARYTHKSPAARTCLLSVFYSGALCRRNSLTGQFLQGKIWTLNKPRAIPSSRPCRLVFSVRLISFCHLAAAAALFFFFFPSCPYFSPLAVSRLLLALYIAPVMFSSLASIHLLVVLLIPSHLLSAPTILHSPCPSLAQFRVPPHFRQFPPFVRIHSRPPVLRLFPPRTRRRRMFSRELSQKLSQKFNIAQRSHTHIWTKLRHKICNY